MRNFIQMTVCLFCAAVVLRADDQPAFVNFIRQVQVPSGVQWDMSVAAASSNGGSMSPLPVDSSGSRFELWTVKSSPLTSYLLDSQFVGAYIPAAEVSIKTEDPYAVMPRTRADRPFTVTVAVSNLLGGATDPAAAKSVNLLRHVQSYGAGGTGVNLDRTQATLLSQVSVSQNGTQTLNYSITSVPGADRAKVRGEERFSVFSLEDYQAPAGQLAAQTVQIWPVADGSISGIREGEKIRVACPPLTFTLNDLYPSSKTYAQVYPGAASLGTTGTVVPGSMLVVNDTVPQSRVLAVKDYGNIFERDGTWTLELLTETPFGIDRLAYVTFDVKLTLKVNGMVTTYE
ncbi:MAG: hypothetical protein J0M04_21740 [Verrucomicrobia bacterium]|nr:hypothetical protein [Verrucomicrobiota bacterium]